MTDLSKQSLPQLRQLSVKIEREIEKRSSQSKTDLLKRMTQLARDAGLSLEDIIGGSKVAVKATRTAPVAARKEPLPAKFVHPSNRELSWSGRGRRPGWIDAWTANGGSLEALENAAQNLAKRARKAATQAAAEPVSSEEPATAE